MVGSTKSLSNASETVTGFGGAAGFAVRRGTVTVGCVVVVAAGSGALARVVSTMVVAGLLTTLTVGLLLRTVRLTTTAWWTGLRGACFAT